MYHLLVSDQWRNRRCLKAICVSDGGGEECSQKEANIN